ncbi:hypothetical protein QE374_002071 [Microbacterium sp. SORGH_AS428]|uniref:hypothetical protein n=1 Tax=Microbacterium sp. SORGH_AS_0428 TaxID=3041788 RepID=UPI00285970A1|nr:hypothetical protein [Microbacterium sp. SORGH_AS_0428]MDR6200162.1 hypothetical protein [Microbacterium sp. SORGH_AS_0428]
MTTTGDPCHWDTWAESIAKKAAVSGIVFLQLGSAYLANAETLEREGFTLVDVDAYLDGDEVDAHRLVLTNMDVLATVSGAARLGRLRAKVHNDAATGRQFVLHSRAPRLIYASLGSALINDAVFATGPSRESWTTDPDDARVFEAELDTARPARSVLRETLWELGPSICARLDRIIFESGDPQVGTEGMDATELEALKGAGLLDGTGGWRVTDLASFFRRELTDVLDAGHHRVDHLGEMVADFAALTSVLRRTIRAAARARWGALWAEELLPELLLGEVVRRASKEIVPMAESPTDIRDVLGWMSLRELLAVRKRCELGGLGMTDGMWRAVDRELSGIEDRLRFFGHVTVQDKAQVRKWGAQFAQKLSHSGHLGVSPNAAASATETEIVKSILVGLRENPAFHTPAGAAFLDLVRTTVRFVRQAAEVKSAYTRPFKDGEAPREAALQEHFYWYLGSTGLGDSTFTEVPNLATGRVDVLTVGEGGARFVTEVKRELTDASINALADSYFGQAAEYLSNGLSLGQLLVLDLTDHSRGVPSVADSIHVETRQVGGSARTIVIFVVRGNRPQPSKVKSPAATEPSLDALQA